MSTSVPPSDEHMSTTAARPSFTDWLMAVGEAERGLIARTPRLRREVRFQALALVMCPASLGYAVYKVAISLLGYTVLGAAPLATLSAISLFALDQHYLVQARGNAAADIRWAMYKVRAVSIAIISLSFALMATDTFRTDIDRVLAEARQSLRAQLEQSPRFQAELQAARESVDSSAEAGGRVQELRAQLARLRSERARALEDMNNEIQGNSTGNLSRQAGFGPKARGFAAAAERLGAEIKAVEEELRQQGNPAAGLAAAKRQLAAIDARIEQETALAMGGSTQRLDALGTLLEHNSSARVAVTFWLLIGALPDLLMLAAQRRMFNHDLFAALRQVEQQDLQAQVAQLRGMVRQRHTDRLTPTEVRLTAATSQAASPGRSGASAHRGHTPEATPAYATTEPLAAAQPATSI